MKTESKVKTVSVSGFEANRLTFRTKNYSPSKPGGEKQLYRWESPDHRIISSDPAYYDSKRLSDAYDDGDDAYFAFFTSDCFDPPLYLIVAANWEEAYDIFLDEFADDEGCEDEIESEARDMWYKATGRDDLVYESKKIEFSSLDEGTRGKYLREAAEELLNNGVLSFASSGARTVGGSPYRWCESINGFELELIKAEKL